MTSDFPSGVIAKSWPSGPVAAQIVPSVLRILSQQRLDRARKLQVAQIGGDNVVKRARFEVRLAGVIPVRGRYSQRRQSNRNRENENDPLHGGSIHCSHLPRRREDAKRMQ